MITLSYNKLLGQIYIHRTKTLHLLASSVLSDRESYRLKLTGKWLVATSHAPFLDAIGHVVSDQWNTAMYAVNMQYMHLLCLFFSHLIETWSQWGLCADQQAAFTIHQDSCTPLMKSDCPLLAMGRVQKAQALSTMLLQVPTATLGTKIQGYFIRWHSLQREGCIASVRQPPVLWD